MCRLRTVGLVEEAGEGEARRVLGDYRHGVLKVPACVVVELRRLPVKGGPRRAGQKGPITMVDERIKAGRGADQSGHESRSKRAPYKISEGETFSPKGENVRSQTTAPFASHGVGRKPVHTDWRTNRLSTTTDPQRADRLHDLMRAGRARVPPFRPPEGGTRDRVGDLLIPPYPSNVLIKPARTPAPPLLTDDMAPDKRVQLLLRAFRAAVKARLGVECWIYPKGLKPTDALYPQLVAAAEELCERGITPVGWAAFSCDIWRTYGGGDDDEPAAGKGKRKRAKWPPLGWVFTTKRIEERAGWYGKEAGSYSGGRLYVGNHHKDMLRRYEGMIRALRMAGGDDLDEDATREIVQRYFPDWQGDLARAQEEAEETQVALDNLKARGEWLW
jgi:hypothetical protein